MRVDTVQWLKYDIGLLTPGADTEKVIALLDVLKYIIALIWGYISAFDRL